MAELAGRGEGTPGAAAQALADHGKRKLIGKQLVIGEPHPRRCGGFEIGGGLRRMHAAQRVGKARPGILLAPSLVDPFGQSGQARERLGDALAQAGVGEACGQRIDRLEQRQLCRAALRVVDRDDVVWVRHLQPAVIGFELAGDEPPASLRQQALEIGRIGVEIDELERARVVLHQNAVRGRERRGADRHAGVRSRSLPAWQARRCGRRRSAASAPGR